LVKQIRGRRYDTDSALLVGTADSAEEAGMEMQKKLYKKRTGEYFLYSVADSSWDIEPMTPMEAERWAKKNFCKKDFFAAFPQKKKERGARVSTTITLKKENYEKIKELAMRANMPLSKFLDRMIQDMEF